MWISHQRGRRFVLGVLLGVTSAVLTCSACGGESTQDRHGDSGAADGGPPRECTSLADCPLGAFACMYNVCLPQDCEDEDGDGAGVGPGCAVFDCLDTDPSVPGPELCNGKDDDCNGLADETCICPDGLIRSCGGAGACAGTQRCQGGHWSSTCDGAKEPLPSEVCGNASDENCDGTMDEGCCPPGEFPCPGLAICSSYGSCD